MGERIRIVTMLTVALTNNVGTDIVGGRAPAIQRITTYVEIPV
jgi:hypothetical protein